MCVSRLSVLIACKLCIFVSFFALCFSVFLYHFIRVMFATFCLYFVYDFYTTTTNNNSTEARAIVRLCRIKEKCLETDLKCVNGWSNVTKKTDAAYQIPRRRMRQGRGLRSLYTKQQRHTHTHTHLASSYFELRYIVTLHRAQQLQLVSTSSYFRSRVQPRPSR